MPKLSFHEKSVLGSLIALVLISAYYFTRAFEMFGANTEGAAGELGRLGIGLLVALIILEAVYHAVIAASSPDDANEEPDERDRLIAAWAGRNAGVALGISMFLLAGHILLNAWYEKEAFTTPLFIVQMILLSLVIYNVVDYVSQLIAYRRGL